MRTPDEVERLTGLDLLAVLPRRHEVRGNLRARLRVAGGALSFSLVRPKQPRAVLGPLLRSSNGATHHGLALDRAASCAAALDPAALDPAVSDNRSELATSNIATSDFAASDPAASGIAGAASASSENAAPKPGLLDRVAAPAASGPSSAAATRGGLPRLAPGSRAASSNGHQSSPHLWDAEAGLSEAYRTLRSSILLGWDDGLRRLLITSSQPQEGKTTVSLNLACSLAQLGRKVLLIDADMRRPNCARQLGVDASHGLSAYLRGTVDFDSLLAATPVNHLSLIHAGSAEAFASDLLCSPRLAELLDEAARRFDHVVIDSPPSLVLSDARTISRQVEGVILVVSDQTDRGALLRTKQTFDDAGVRLVGFVMNRVNLADLDYGYYRHYGYYYAYGEKQGG